MNYPAHAIGGITIGIATQQLVIPMLPVILDAGFPIAAATGIYMAATLLGSLMPDVDHRGSYIGRRLPLLSFLFSHTIGHRGATHAPIINALLTIATITGSSYFLDGLPLVMATVFLVGLFIGAMSHLFLDAMTEMGIPLLYPFTTKHYRLSRLKTGGWGEKFVTLLMIGLNILMIYH